MSRLDIKGVWPNEKAETICELHNYHLGAPLVWSFWCIKFMGLEKYGWLISDPINEWSRKKVNRLLSRKDIPDDCKIVMALTMDHAMIMKNDFIKTAKLLNIFSGRLEISGHWPEIARVLYNNSDKNIPAIGFNMTTVSDDLFAEWKDHPIDWESKFDVWEYLTELNK